MGFKCPTCKKDFKQNKSKWKEHLKTSHLGLGQDIPEAMDVLNGIYKKDKHKKKEVK